MVWYNLMIRSLTQFLDIAIEIKQSPVLMHFEVICGRMEQHAMFETVIVFGSVAIF